MEVAGDFRFIVDLFPRAMNTGIVTKTTTIRATTKSMQSCNGALVRCELEFRETETTLVDDEISVSVVALCDTELLVLAPTKFVVLGMLVLDFTVELTVEPVSDPVTLLVVVAVVVCIIVVLVVDWAVVFEPVEVAVADCVVE